MNHKNLQQCPSAGLFKQLIAMLYDSFLIVALLFIATTILLPFNKGEAITGPIFTLYLLLIIFIFYSWFWNKAGQTLGMKVWKIRIINDYGFNPSWSICFLRLFIAILPPSVFIALNTYFGFTQDMKTIAIISVAIFLLGYIWRLFTPYTWHDRLSQTRIIDVSGIKQDHK